VGELLSGAEGQFRGQGMGTAGRAGPAGRAHGPVPGLPLSVEEALDGDLDAYLDRELFVRPGPDSDSEESEARPATAASGSMRALLDLAEEEAQWLKTLPPPSPSEDTPPEPPVEIPEWMRISPGAKVTTRFAAMLGPVDPDSVPAHPEVAHGGVGTDAAGLQLTPWSVPTSAPLARTSPAYPAHLLPGIAPPPPGVQLPQWAPQHAAPMAQSPQRWGMALPAPAEPKRITGMKPGAFLGAAAVGALAAGMLGVAGLHLQERVSGTQAATVAGVGPGTLTGADVASTQGQHQGLPSAGAQAGTAQAGSTRLNGGALAGTGPLLPSAGAQGEPFTEPSASHSGAPGATMSGLSGAQQAAASVAGSVLSTARGDVQGAANGLRAPTPTSGPVSGPAVGSPPLSPLQPDAVATRAPSARKVSTKTALTSPPRDEAESTGPGEHTFNESESSGADEESVPAEAADAEAATETPQSELDEDFARELGFTEDAEQKALPHAAPERTVYVPPAPNAKEQLTPDDVKAVVVTNQPAITACIRQHARGTPVEGGGRFLVRWSVLPSGDTSSVSMETDTLKATSLAHCIEEVVRSWKFPAHQVRMQEPIRFPFVF